MRRLIIRLMLSVCVGITSTAGASSQEDAVKALDAADKLSVLQDQKIAKQESIIKQQRDENNSLSEALIRMKELNDKELQMNLTWGIAGFAAGILLLSVVKK